MLSNFNETEETKLLCCKLRHGSFFFLPKNILPTIGATGVVMALQLCDQVSLAGFGYDMQHPEARLHYYEAIRMDTMKSQVSLA